MKIDPISEFMLLLLLGIIPCTLFPILHDPLNSHWIKLVHFLVVLHITTKIDAIAVSC